MIMPYQKPQYPTPKFEIWGDIFDKEKQRMVFHGWSQHTNLHHSVMSLSHSKDVDSTNAQKCIIPEYEV